MRRALGLLGLQLAGCGAGQTHLEGVFQEEHSPGSMARLEVAMRGARVPEGAALAIGAVSEGIVGISLVGGSVWEFRHALSTRPEVVGGVVVGSGGGQVFALRASTGALLWARPTGGLELIGAGDDGELTVVTLASASGQSNTVLAINRGGQVQRQLETSKRLGRPAVLRGVAFIPWMERHVTAYDVLLGQEIARLSMKRGVSAAVVGQGALFFGDQTLVRFDEQLGLWPADQLPRVELPEGGLQGSPRVLPRVKDTRALLAGEPDRSRVYALPTEPGGPLGLRGGRYYVTSHRAVIARRTDGEIPLWVRLLELPPLGGAAFPGGLALCDESGKISLLSEVSGNVEATLSLGRPVLSCVVQGGALARSDSGAPAPPLPEQLAAVLQMPESELAPVQREALGLLARLKDEETTRVLLDLCVDARTPVVLLPELYPLVAQRRGGTEALLRALGRLPDPRTDQGRPTPVPALAEALLAQRERKAAALLLAHLEHPYSAPPAVRAAARALAELGTAAELGGLESFFALNRCVAPDDDLRSAVVSAAQAIRKLGGVEGLRLVKEAAVDPLTEPAVREQLAALVAERAATVVRPSERN